MRGQWSDSSSQQQTIDDVRCSYTLGELSAVASADLASQLLNSDEDVFRQLGNLCTLRRMDS